MKIIKRYQWSNPDFLLIYKTDFWPNFIIYFDNPSLSRSKTGAPGVAKLEQLASEEVTLKLAHNLRGPVEYANITEVSHSRPCNTSGHWLRIKRRVASVRVPAASNKREGFQCDLKLSHIDMTAATDEALLIKVPKAASVKRSTSIKPFIDT